MNTGRRNSEPTLKPFLAAMSDLFAGDRAVLLRAVVRRLPVRVWSRHTVSALPSLRGPMVGHTIPHLLPPIYEHVL